MIPFVPLDDRPCCRDFPVALAPLAGDSLELPPGALLGRASTPGDSDALLDWLQQTTGTPLVSVDMLLYGGLVASRSPAVPVQAVEQRLQRLEEVIRARRPYAFNVLMRVPPFCTSDEERRFSERLMAYSRAVARGSGLRQRLLRRGIPDAFLTAYLDARARNHAVNRRFLEWARGGVLAYGLLGMDDSATEGFNVAERDLLQPLVPEHADLIPGADELALLLLARMALDRAGRRPRVEVRFSPDSLRGRTTKYEDRPVEALIRAHLHVLQAPVTREAPDLVLFVHGPSRGQGEAAVQLPGPVPKRIRAFVQDIGEAVAAGRQVAVADLGYANGADRAFVRTLAQEVPLAQLAGYAAWNTGGNTVGTVLAHAVLRWLSLEHPLPGTHPRQAAEAHLSFLFERFLDDHEYQSGVRQQLAAKAALRRLNIYDLGSAWHDFEAEAADRLRSAGESLFTEKFARGETRGPDATRWRISGPLALEVSLPWPRIFEVRIRSRIGLEPLA